MSGDWFSINDLIRRVLVVNLNRLFFFNRLDVSLSDVLISRKIIISSLWVVLDLYWSLNGWKSSSNGLRRLYSYLLLDSSYSWLDKVTVVDLISFYLYVSYSLFLSELGLSCDWVSVNEFVFLFNELRSDFFSDSSNRRLNDNFLSSRLNDLLSDDSWISYYSLSDDLWLSRNSLSNDSWLNSNIFGSYFGISQ